MPIDEYALRKAIDEANRAEQLVNNEMLQEAFEKLQSTYIEAWRGTHVDATSAREKLFLAVNIVGKVKEHLNFIVSNGRLAKAELDTIL
jgi:hypothetical protein